MQSKCNHSSEIVVMLNGVVKRGTGITVGNSLKSLQKPGSRLGICDSSEPPWLQRLVTYCSEHNVCYE